MAKKTFKVILESSDGFQTSAALVQIVSRASCLHKTRHSTSNRTSRRHSRRKTISCAQSTAVLSLSICRTSTLASLEAWKSGET